MCETIPCEECGKLTNKYNMNKYKYKEGFYPAKNRIRRFCSTECTSSYKKNNRKIIKCKICGADSKRDKYCLECSIIISKEQDKKSYHTIYQSIQKPNSQKLKRILISTLGGKCNVCGYKDSLSSLVFHHVKTTNKLFTLDCTSLYKRNIHDIILELNKCELLCQNCHCEKHQKEKLTYTKTYLSKRYKYIQKKLQLLSIFSNKCGHCSKTFNVDNMSSAEFHNVSDKTFYINANTLIRKSDNEIEEELKKCILLCKNCHIKHHYG